MQHGVAVRAHRAQIGHRVDIALAGSQIVEVVDVNKPTSELPVAILEIEVADSAAMTVRGDARSSSFGASFGAVY